MCIRDRSNDRQISTQNVDKLRQLVNMQLADDAPHRGDAPIAVAGGQARNAVLFRVHTHTAEFVDLKNLAALRQALLRVKHRSAVADLDADRRDEKPVSYTHLDVYKRQS